jgi:hypothetical protein
MAQYIENIVIGNPIVEPKELFAKDDKDWEEVERSKTLFTEERFLPKILVEIGAYKSINEIRKNKPDLVKELNDMDYIDKLKVSKKRFIWIIIGPKED